MASNLEAMASNPIAMASNLITMAFNLLAMASNLVAMASNLDAMASNLIAMPSNLLLHGLQPTSNGLQPTSHGLEPSSSRGKAHCRDSFHRSFAVLSPSITLIIWSGVPCLWPSAELFAGVPQEIPERRSRPKKLPKLDPAAQKVPKPISCKKKHYTI